jgi:tRNA(Ile)-lysidine synthase
VSGSVERPLDAATFAALMSRFEPFEARPELSVAVSGGRDSLALAVLAHGWASERGGRVLALIVDHGLRTEAADEAATTSALLQRLGITGLVLRWSGAKPASALQEIAREARYRLLREACCGHGILHLLVAHHADDQAETVTMRAARRSGPDGLAGMAALVELPEVRLLRPLLGVPRSRLAATLMARGIAWIDDPSNIDPRFERARLRRAGVMAADAYSAGRARAHEETRAAHAAVAVLEFEPDDSVAIDRAGFVQLSQDLRLRLLKRVVQAVGGGDHPPRRDRLERAEGRLSAAAGRGESGRASDFTLSGCRLILRQDAAIPAVGAVPDRRLRWIVRPENGRKGGQPLIPAAFFACGPSAATHVLQSPYLAEANCEPVQS